MPEYTDKQSWLAKSFPGVHTLCSVGCQHCGRCHFVACKGHGDYGDGELEGLLAKADQQPDKYVAEWEYDYVEAILIDGKQIVVDCPCGKAAMYADWFLGNLHELAQFCRFALEEEAKEAQRKLKDASELAEALTIGATP